MASDDPVFVTGATGFIGGALVRRLLDDGRHVCAPLRPAARRWRIAELENHDRLQIVEADVTDRASIEAALEASKPKVVIHLAAHGAYESQSDPRAIFETNVTGTSNLLEASVAAGVELFVNAGSSSEYGYKSEPMRETDRVEPNSHYAISKVAQTHLCRLTSELHDLPLVTFRLFSVYGPWEEPTRLVPTLLSRARAGETLQMANPEIARDFVYVGDVLDALCAFDALRSFRGEVINLGSGVETTLREVVDAVLSVVPSESSVNWGGMAARKWDTDRWVSDPSKAKLLLGWSATHDLIAGLKKTSEWMKGRDEHGR